MNELLTKKELAKWLKVSQRTIDRLRSEGKLTALKVGAAVRFQVEKLDKEIVKFTERR